MSPSAIVVKIQQSPAQTQDVCFIAMPFAKEFHKLSDLIMKAAITINLRPIRTDEVQMTDSFIKDVVLHMRAARLVVAVCTPEPQTGTPNPNVMFELGYAQALGKPTAILTTEKLPSDVQSNYALIYNEDDMKEGGALVSKIVNLFRNLLDRSPNSLTDDTHYPHISVAQSRYGMLVYPEFWGKFKNIFDYANKIQQRFQFVEIYYIGPLLLQATAATKSRAVGSTEVEAFRSQWNDYDERFQKITQEIYQSRRREQQEVEECFTRLSSDADEISSASVEKCRAFYKLMCLRLEKHLDIHNDFKNNYDGKFEELMKPAGAVILSDEMKQFQSSMRDVLIQANSLMGNLVGLIAE